MLQDKAKRKQLKVKLSMAKFLQDTVEEMALSSESPKNQKETKEFYEFIEKVRQLNCDGLEIYIVFFCLNHYKLNASVRMYGPCECM